MVTVSVTGENRVDLVKKLKAFAANLEGMPANKAGKVEEHEEEGTSEAPEEEEEFAAKPAKKTKPAASFDDEAEETVEEEATEEEEETPPPKKSKIDAKAVNEACKAHAKKNGFEVTKALLLKKFKTSSVAKLKPESYADVVKAMKA